MCTKYENIIFHTVTADNSAYSLILKNGELEHSVHRDSQLRVQGHVLTRLCCPDCVVDEVYVTW